MIDIHNHILYGVDDGSKDLDMSLAMLKEEMEQGVSTVYLTPHQNQQTLTGPLLKERYQSFLEELKDKGIDMDIRLGAEIYYYPGLKQDLLSGKALTMDESKYVLVEFSTRTETNVSEIVYELVMAGFTPIIAHIERYPYLKKEDYFDIKEAGGLIQINSGSFSHFSSRGLIKYLLKNDLVDYVATDAHDNSKRKVDFSFVHSYIKKKYPDLYTKLIEMKKIG
jgi:protein-tyrosine phosphatase